MAVAKKAPQQVDFKPLMTYGCPVDPREIRSILGDNAQFFYDQWAFSHRIPIDQGAPPRPVLFKRITDALLPGYFEWHPWTDRVVDAGCHEQWIGLAGCSGSAKTHNVAGFACAWWLCDPNNSSVIFCSTTSKALRKRSWAEVQRCFTTIPGPRVGNFVDSRMMWQANKGDDKHAIMGIAVEEGDALKVADNIKGVHTKRQMIVITEATAVPHAIFEACTNLYSYPEQAGGEFILWMEANPRSWYDEFGKFIEPDDGIKSVTPEMEEWETRPQINGRKGICIRFDIEKSPNLDYPEATPISKHLPTHARLRKIQDSPGYKDSPSYWSNERGFPPPEGLNKNLWSEISLETSGVFDQHEFNGERFEIIGAFDPARTGDKPTLRFAALGSLMNGDLGIEWMKPIVIPVDANSRNPINYQIIEQLKRECEHVWYRGQRLFCPYKNLGIDATGGGADFCDSAQRVLSMDIIRIEFNGASSTDSCNLEDARPANEVYRNKRAEMYFRTRDACESGQIKGIDRETAKEMTSIEYDDGSSKPGARKLITIVAKEIYREKYKKSPDATDTGVMLTEVARRKGFKLGARGLTVLRSQNFSHVVKSAQSIYQNMDYGPEEQPQESTSMDDVLDQIGSIQ